MLIIWEINYLRNKLKKKIHLSENVKFVKLIIISVSVTLIATSYIAYLLFYNNNSFSVYLKLKNEELLLKKNISILQNQNVILQKKILELENLEPE